MTKQIRLTKAKLRALETVFAAEIDDRLPFQSKARVYRTLHAEGYLVAMQRTFGTGWSAAVATGYALTHLGRMTYCESCRDIEDEPV
jgi:hypothetical protein